MRRFFLRPGQHDGRLPPVKDILQVIGEDIDAPRPHRKLSGVEIVQRPEGKLLPGAGKSLQQQAAAPFQRQGDAVPFQGVVRQPPAKLAFLQQGFNVLMKLPVGGAHPFPHPPQLGNEHQGVGPGVIEQGGGLRVNKRYVFIQGGGQAPSPEPVDVRQQVLPLRRRALAPQTGSQGLDFVRQGGPVIV